MKVKASVKKRCKQCKIIRRHGVILLPAIILATNSGKGNY
jgi:ribosomal protein L36